MFIGIVAVYNNINKNLTNCRKVGTNVVIKPGIEDHRINVVYENNDGSVTATLTIKHLNRSDDGLYTCVASNKVRMARIYGYTAWAF